MSGYGLFVAYERLIKQDEVWDKLKLTKKKVFSIRSHIYHGRYPSESVMRKQLRSAGWEMVQTEKWDHHAPGRSMVSKKSNH